MLRLGVLGGKYMTDCRREFQESWFTRAKLSLKGRDPTLNFFGVDASQPLSFWRRKGWLHRDDPRGWYQWCCRYYMGRRTPEEDTRQIRRWKQMSDTWRKSGSIAKRMISRVANGNVRRCCIWACDSRKSDGAVGQPFHSTSGGAARCPRGHRQGCPGGTVGRVISPCRPRHLVVVGP
jgi:hypothetical protein